MLQQQPVQVCDSGRDNPFGNQAGGNHNGDNGDNGYIDPRLLSLSSQDQWQPTQPQQPSANPEPDVAPSPASPPKSEDLDGEFQWEDDSGMVDTGINPFSGEPWKEGELEDLMRENGEELEDESTPVDYEISPFTGKSFPKPSDQSPAPQSTEPTAPEDDESSKEDRPDKGKGKEPLQPTQGVSPSQRAVNPIRRRRPRPVASDFFSAPPEQNPFDGDDEDSDSDSDSEYDRKKKARPHFTTTTDDELLPDDPRPSNNNEDDEDDPANFPVFNDSTLFHPSPSSNNAYTTYLNQTVAAQREVKAAWSAANPNPDPYNRNPASRRRQASVSSDEDEMAFEDAFPDEPEVGSKGNGYGSKRRGRDGELVDAPSESEEEQEPTDATPAFDPAALNNLSPAQLGGSVSVVGNTASGSGPYTADPNAGQEDADDDEGMESEDEDGAENEDAPNNNPHFHTSAPWDPMRARHQTRNHNPPSENDGDDEDDMDEEVARKFAEREREGRELAERVRRMEEGDDDGEL